MSSSFNFLLNKPQKLEQTVLRDDGLFYSALSGFSDAEGHVGLKKNGSKGYARYALSNRNLQLIQGFMRGLISRGHNARLYALGGEKVQWQLEVHGPYALKLLPCIRFRHREKIVGRQIVLAHHGNLWKIAGPIYLAHREAIKVERSALEAIAARRFGLRDNRKRRKSEIFRQRVESTFELFAKGLGVQEVAETLNCSIRTAYRRKEKFRVESHG